MRNAPINKRGGQTLRKRALVMQSAIRLFIRNGYSHTSMDAIAADAGVSKQTVYSYFTNKEQLFRHMIEELCNSHTPPESWLNGRGLLPGDALHKIGQGFMDTISSRTGIGVYRLAMAEGSRNPRVAELFFQSGPQKMQDTLVRYLERQVKDGTLAIANIDRAAGHFFAMLKGWYQMRLAMKLKPQPGKKELEQHVRETVQVFCRAYGGNV